MQVGPFRSRNQGKLVLYRRFPVNSFRKSPFQRRAAVAVAENCIFATGRTDQELHRPRWKVAFLQLDSEAAPGMNAGQPGMEKSRGIDDPHRLRLVALLNDLVGDNAASRSTAGSDVGQRTLAASPENKGLTRRMLVLLDDNQGQAELPGNAAPAAADTGPGDVAKVAATGGGRFSVGFRKLH